VPIIKNMRFQPTGAMLSDGTMLHLLSREEREVSTSDLQAPHLKGLIASGQLALQERDREESAAQSGKPIADSARPEPTESEPETSTASSVAERGRKQPSARDELETE